MHKDVKRTVFWVMAPCNFEIALHVEDKRVKELEDMHCRMGSFLTMLYSPQNRWGSGPCPSSGILNTRKHNVSEIGCFRNVVFCNFFKFRAMGKVQKPSNSEGCTASSTASVV
jgi:hypothetical protein